MIIALHPSYSNQTDNIRARMKRRRKGKRGRRGFRGRVPSCSAGPTILSHMTHWNRTLRDSERRPGVPSGRRRPDMPSHRGPIVGWCHATGTWLAIALPCPLGHAPLIRLCCPLLLHSYTIISSRGLPLLPLTDNWTLSMIRLSVVISRHEPHFCCKIMVPLYD